MGGARTGEFPSESLLRIVMSSSPCSTFTYKAGLSYIVHVEDRPAPWMLPSLNHSCHTLEISQA
jgi:hypothetical protein